MPERLEALEPGKSVILAVKLGQSYRRDDWLVYVQSLLKEATLAYAALLDSDEELVAFIPGSDLRAGLNDFALGGERIRANETRDLEAIRAFPHVRSETLESGGICRFRIARDAVSQHGHSHRFF